MEFLTALVGAVVGGLISWAALGWQLRRQAAVARAQLREQSQLAHANARAEMRLRMQVEEFQDLKRLVSQIFREFVEIDHDAGHVIEDPEDRHYRQDIDNRVGTVRQIARGEAKLIGDELSRELLAATDLWIRFADEPQRDLRAAAQEASMATQRGLDRLVGDRGQGLGSARPPAGLSRYP